MFDSVVWSITRYNSTSNQKMVTVCGVEYQPLIVTFIDIETASNLL